MVRRMAKVTQIPSFLPYRGLEIDWGPLPPSHLACSVREGEATSKGAGEENEYGESVSARLSHPHLWRARLSSARPIALTLSISHPSPCSSLLLTADHLGQLTYSSSEPLMPTNFLIIQPFSSFPSSSSGCSHFFVLPSPSHQAPSSLSLPHCSLTMRPILICFACALRVVSRPRLPHCPPHSATPI